MEIEPVAVRYDFDGFGWQYLDSGSGSDWLTREPEAQLLYTAEDVAALAAEVRALRGDVERCEAERKLMSARIAAQRKECRWMLTWSNALHETFQRCIAERQGLFAKIAALEKWVETLTGDAKSLRENANGNFECDDGERGFLVHSDDMRLLETALSGATP